MESSKIPWKICNINVQTEGGGGEGGLKQCRIWSIGTSLTEKTAIFLEKIDFSGIPYQVPSTNTSYSTLF